MSRKDTSKENPELFSCIIMLVNCLIVALRSFNIYVNSIIVGIIKTELHAKTVEVCSI